jgi:hypothetical protein
LGFCQGLLTFRVLFLLIGSKINLPMDVIIAISLIILPKNVPEETITIYRNNFFFKNNKPTDNICPTVEEEEDSQEEIKGINFDSY